MGGGIASNDAELAAMLAPDVIKGLQMMGERDLEPMITSEINMHTHRGNFYSGGGAGSLEKAWTTKSVSFGGQTLGEMETYYDSGKLGHDSLRGQHITPLEYARGRQESITDMATLIDKGLGGMLFGPDNPTSIPTGFWDAGVIPQFKANADRWIRAGLLAAGLPLI